MGFLGVDVNKSVFDAQPHGPRAHGPKVRQFGLVNWLGLWTLYEKEVRRFIKVSVQTVLAPAVQTVLFMLALSLAFNNARGDILGVRFEQFLGPGLVMMAVINAGFSNTSSSLIVSKLQGNAVDFLMPPLSSAELAAAFLGGSVTRGVLVACVGVLGVAPMAGLSIANPLLIGFFLISAALIMSAIGLIAGIWAEKFDHLAAVTSFVIMPLSFLSGTFYSLDRLPELVAAIARWNPVFCMIDGFRAGFLGVSDAPLWRSMVVVGVLDLVLVGCTYVILRSGWRLKA